MDVMSKVKNILICDDNEAVHETIGTYIQLDVLINGFYLVFFTASFVSTVIILVLIYYFTRKLIKPLTEMAEVSNSMASEEFF